MKRLSLLPFGCVGLLLVACDSSHSTALPPASGSGAPPLPVIASVTAPGGSAAPADRALIVSGTARALHEAKLGPRVTGVIEAMLVEEGDRVKKGQVLFRLRSAAQDLGVRQAEAGLATAEVMQMSALTELERTQALSASGSVAPAALDQVKARYDAAVAGVRQAQAGVNSARQASSETAVTSPIAGIVSARRASVGETVTMMPPTTVLVIQDIDVLEVRANLPETSLASLHPGSVVRVRFPAIEIVREVPVTRINPSVDPMTRTIEVVAEVPNPDHALKAGMLVECDFRAAASAASAATAATGPAGAASGARAATAGSASIPAGSKAR